MLARAGISSSRFVGVPDGRTGASNGPCWLGSGKEAAVLQLALGGRVQRRSWLVTLVLMCVMRVCGFCW
jgi:hypothetical protein